MLSTSKKFDAAVLVLPSHAMNPKLNTLARTLGILFYGLVSWLAKKNSSYIIGDVRRLIATLREIPPAWVLTQKIMRTIYML